MKEYQCIGWKPDISSQYSEQYLKEVFSLDNAADFELSVYYKFRNTLEFLKYCHGRIGELTYNPAAIWQANKAMQPTDKAGG